MTAGDRPGNQAAQPFHVIEDTGAPTVTIHVPQVAPLRFWVSWSGQDWESGVRDYDVQYKVGITSTWTSWLTNTSQTQAPFVGEAGESHFFQVKATDNVNNTSAWVEARPVAVSAVTKYYYHGTQRTVRPASAARRDRHAPGRCDIPRPAWLPPGQATPCPTTQSSQGGTSLVMTGENGAEAGRLLYDALRQAHLCLRHKCRQGKLYGAVLTSTLPAALAGQGATPDPATGLVYPSG